ncbi:GNAT family N-acetyltransferase [Halalkalibacillus sediminis]|uniref:GNAT family N-acetyltransferase n=1 Tax=Halalkalibacillus sediminis TaxID=2018042 RepID=A0A2I0QRY2_9BACI|nr:GNAT family N-acetyltransferase [Halalkalibacillus sediminis]PKR77081.1 GNAT family N-acetyltransferase [Halalkalibacillus sediminis]
MNIRHATEKDLPVILEIYNEAIRTLTATLDNEEMDLEERENWLKSHEDPFFVLVGEIDGNVVGYGSISPHSSKEGYRPTSNLSIYLKAECRGRGYGARMMQALIDQAVDNGFHSVLSLIASGNEASVYLHEQFGFEHRGTLKEVGWKFNRWLDVYYYQKNL